MRRLKTLPRLSSCLVVIATTAIVHSSPESLGQQSGAPPRLASVATNSGPTHAETQQDPLLSQLDLAIEVTSKRYLTANIHSPWQIFHGILALKRDFQLKLGNDKVNALHWIATSEPRFDNQPLLLKTAHGGKFHPFTRPYAFEGHPAQFLALMSQSELPVDYSFKVGNEHITVAGMVNNTMKEVNSVEEVTWVLWALQYYLKPDAQWTNQWNEAWSIERLVQIETAAPVVGAPCGGNHRLFALTRTRDKYLAHGGKLQGIWAQADLKIRQHIELARSLQNTDGSFSSKFYERPAISNDLNTRFNTTGHTMEFLSIGLPDARIKEPWVRNAVAMLCRELIDNRHRQIDCGPLYHTLNSLIIYRDRLHAQPPSLASVKTPGSATTPITKPTGQGKSVEASKPDSSKVNDEPIPSALSPSTNSSLKSTKQATATPAAIDTKGIEPGRLPPTTPSSSTVTKPAPALLPDANAKPTEALELPSGDRESLDSTVGTLKPRFENPPPPSRSTLGKPAASGSQGTLSQLPIVDEDVPTSALQPANLR